MPTLTIIVGLPGSGKSHLLLSLIESGELSPDLAFEEVCHPNKVHGPKGIAEVILQLQAGCDCFVEDATFCIRENRATFEYFILSAGIPGLTIEYHYFKNEPFKALSNILYDYQYKNRPDVIDRSTAFFNILAAGYDIPGGAKTMDIQQQHVEVSAF